MVPHCVGYLVAKQGRWDEAGVWCRCQAKAQKEREEDDDVEEAMVMVVGCPRPNSELRRG